MRVLESPGVGTGRQAGFRFQCPSGVRVRLPPWAPLFCFALGFAFDKRPGGEIGRHKGLKIPRLHGRAGSIPAPGTIDPLSVNSRFDIGWVAEWLCSGLQLRVHRFDSGLSLHSFSLQTPKARLIIYLSIS